MRLEKIPRRWLVMILLVVALVGLFLMSYLNWRCSIETVGQWAESHPGGVTPSPRTGQALVYDEAGDRLILFGGTFAETMDATDEGWTYRGDTWTYDPSEGVWTELRPSGEVPSPRSGSSMVYVPETQTVLVFGGDNETTEPGTGLNDLWEYDPASNSWAELDPPGDRPEGWESHVAVYDSRSQRMLAFGSDPEQLDSIPFEYVNELWSYDPAANVWTRLEPEGERPPGLVGASMVYDPDTGHVLVFGGYYMTWDEKDPAESFEPAPNETLWIYDPAADSWSAAKPGGDPPLTGSWTPYLVYDASLKQTVLFIQGITGDGETVSGMWLYDAATNEWTRTEPTGSSPSLRWTGSMVFWPQGPAIVLYGGNAPSRPDALDDRTQAYVYPASLWIFTASAAGDE